MPSMRVDVAVLGAGSAGLSARRAAEKAGAKAVLIDPGPLGTTCARVGCMPSKLLIAAADAAYHARHAGVFGVNTTVAIDGPAVMARVQRERDRFVGFVLESTDALAERGALLHGRARLLGPRHLAVSDAHGTDTHELEVGATVIATGSTPFTPPPFRGLEDLVLTNDNLFDLPDLPDSVLVVGAGVIGLELGQALHRLGVRVAIVDLMNSIGPLSDPKMIAAAKAIFSAELPVFPGYRLGGITREKGGVSVRWTDSGGAEHAGHFQHVLLAAGRRSNLDGLGLAEAGVHWDGRGIPPFNPNTMQVGELPIFLAGDVNGDRPLLHEAADEGSIAGENAARYPNLQPGFRRTPLAIVFSDPQIAVVGARWASMRCDENRVGEVDYGDQGRARVMNQNRGRVRIYAEHGTGRLLGAEMIGPGVEHTAHLLAWAIQSRLTVSQALAMPFYHPVVEEGIRTALRDLEGKLGITLPPGAACEEFGPGT